MNPWVMVAIVPFVLYGLWLLLAQVFLLIDVAHELRRESERRTSGV